MRQTLFEDPAIDDPGGRVTGVTDKGGELFSKSWSYFFIIGERFGENSDGFLQPERDFSRSQNRFDYFCGSKILLSGSIFVEWSL